MYHTTGSNWLSRHYISYMLYGIRSPLAMPPPESEGSFEVLLLFWSTSTVHCPLPDFRITRQHDRSYNTQHIETSRHISEPCRIYQWQHFGSKRTRMSGLRIAGYTNLQLIRTSSSLMITLIMAGRELEPITLRWMHKIKESTNLQTPLRIQNGS